MPEVKALRQGEAREEGGLSEFQSEVVQLGAVLNGDHFLSSFPDEMSKKMSVKEGDEYVKGAVSRFMRASKEAIKLGADDSAIVDMRSSLTTRSSIHNWIYYLYIQKLERNLEKKKRMIITIIVTQGLALYLVTGHLICDITLDSWKWNANTR